MPYQLRREEYTVGWVCALAIELAAAQEMLDNEHDTPPCDAHDSNIYSCGRVGEHNVVIACLPEGQIGTNSAAAVAMQMKSAFTSIRFGLMVGIGGGVPSKEADVRLGDVVVSKPHKVHGGVVQYDMGKATPSGFERTGFLNTPPTILLNAVANLRAKHIRGRSQLLEHLAKLDNLSEFARQAAGPDVLFKAKYNHKGGATCIKCSKRSAVSRPVRRQEVVVHHGTVASGNHVMEDAAERNRVSEELGGVLCFETEAAGLMNSFPCLVIRGICDYADSHENKRWQSYAAGAAAAYAKELLSVLPAAEVAKIRRAEDAMYSANKRSLQSPSPDRAPRKRKRTEEPNGIENTFVEQRTATLPIRNQEQTRTSLNEEQRQSLFKSLEFEQIDAHQMTIKAAHAKTCRWLLKNVQYLTWLNPIKSSEHHGFLWIKGNAGTGKSTLMKFAFDNARKTMENRIVLSFFFNARGEDMEKSTIGAYRSLLLQLLKRLPALKSVFDSLSLSTSTFSKDHQWSIEPLKTLLEQAIRQLGQSSVVCFIDALDECEEKQIREMIQFFQHVGELAISNSIRFQICFSSRHYPYITMDNGLELVLEGQEGHTQDITNYVETELKIGKSRTAQQIRVELQEKASGIFMWVVLVVRILNKESDCGKIYSLRQKLHEIPGDLHDLFRDMLTRDSLNTDGLILCIQWVLFAKQPLSPEQLYHAILSGINAEAVTEWDPREITKDVIKLFILDSSKGLAEVTVSKEPKVQFIHESVREFLLTENGLSKIWPELGSNFRGQSHERLKQCCLNYVSIDVVTSWNIPHTLSSASSKLVAVLRNLATQMLPFLEYAIQNMLYHADTAAGSDITQMHFLESFPSPRWVTLINLFQKRQVRRHKQRVSCLYLLAEFNAANLIEVLGSASRCMHVEAEKYGCPLFAALAMGSEETVELFIKSIAMQSASENPAGAIEERKSRHNSAQRGARPGFVYSKTRGLLLGAAELGHDEVLTLLLRLGVLGIDSKDSNGRTVLWWASKNGCEKATRMLLDPGFVTINSKDKDDSAPLHIAAYEGNKTVVEMLLAKGCDINAQGRDFGTVLCAASMGGHGEIVALLLERGADINAQVGPYGHALHAASRRGHSEVVTLLLDRGAEINAQDRSGFDSPLLAASSEGHRDIVTLLLDRGADINAQGGTENNALYVASDGGHQEIVTVLLERGANVNAKGGYHGNALQAASFGGYSEIVRLLLKRGADINAQGGRYGNALQTALYKGHKEIVTILLDKGANINAQGGRYGNALQAASFRGYSEIVRLLLKRGADINAQGGEYGSALQAASYEGHKEVVILLLDKGADVNAKGGKYSSALQAASFGGYSEIVRLLLKRGADINAQGGEYGNALQAASFGGYEEIVRLLLKRGADINAQGGEYGNALQAASFGGYEEIVRLLLKRGADINAQGGEYSSALQAASSEGFEEIVKLLLDKGADANA